MQTAQSRARHLMVQRYVKEYLPLSAQLKLESANEVSGIETIITRKRRLDRARKRAQLLVIANHYKEYREEYEKAVKEGYPRTWRKD